MKKTMIPLVLTGLISGSAIASGTGAEWGYTGENGPDNWDKLSSAYEMCGKGRNQSPVNLTDMIEGDLPPLELRYQRDGREIVNNGHTIQINYAPGSTLSVAGKAYELKQLHFHAPSENQIGGESFPMEAHFVHADAAGNLAVLALMIEEGYENKALKNAWSHMPEKAGENLALSKPFNASELLPSYDDDELEYYRFNGSLTTPPCSEGVVWMVLKETVQASADQIEKFAHIMHHPNNRPVQPINARVIVQ